VPATSAAAPADQQPAPEPVAAPQREPAVQLIRAGSGCQACPGERRLEEPDGAP
jgi:hypothetical protein